MHPKLSDIKKVIATFSRGEIVLIFDDDPKREMEADLVCSASLITPQNIEFMAHKGGGIICVAMKADIVDNLCLPMMTNNSNDPLGTAWMLSVDHHDNTTGISAFDRTATIKALINPQSKLIDFTMPGHIFPLRARPGGLNERRGHTEASVALAEASGLSGAATICELMMPNGSMADFEDTIAFTSEYGLEVCTISQLVRELSHKII